MSDQVDEWQHQLAVELFDQRLAAWVRRWDLAEDTFQALPASVQETIRHTTTTDIDRALDFLMIDMATRVHPDVRTYMRAMVPQATAPDVVALRAEVAGLRRRVETLEAMVRG